MPQNRTTPASSAMTSRVREPARQRRCRPASAGARRDLARTRPAGAGRGAGRPRSRRRGGRPVRSVAAMSGCVKPADGLGAVLGGVQPGPAGAGRRAAGQPGGRQPAAAGRAGSRRRGRRRGHPPAAPARRATWTSRSPAGSCPYFEGNEERRHARSWSRRCAPAGRSLLVTDGGMPSVSDPGYRLVAAAVAAGMPVTAVPGPSRGDHRAGRCPGCRATGSASRASCRARPGERRRALAALADERAHAGASSRRRTGWPPRSPTLAAAFGPDRPAAACRELTKTYEEVRRGTLGELAEWAAAGVRGEITLVVGAAPRPAVRRRPGRAAPTRSRPGRPPAADREGGDRRGRPRTPGCRSGCLRRGGGGALDRRGIATASLRWVGACPIDHILTAVAWPYANGPRHIGHAPPPCPRTSSAATTGWRATTS